ncbi:type II toxin-antitoxin system VapC family toxin [Mucilaginibacter sp. McL0603]|uniref:type II toxin-antitoxin system VapC family toxin n=1 Tax=Mucilaginibacter sp. McL0603 TaxID=3415670 RepID=UPI003CEA0159
MGLKYLWDTNTVVHYLQKQFPPAGEEFIDNTLNKYQPAISVITEIELLCWKKATESDRVLINNFISNAIVHQLNQNVKLKTIDIRKKYGLKLPDAIVAASALANNHILITNDVADFDKIYKLKVIDPFKLVK